MKKSKMLLPLLAIVFAIASAFATEPVVQSAWYNSGVNSSSPGDITTPTDRECAVGRVAQCFIGTNVAYDSPQTAASQDSDGLLKYNP